MKTKFIKVTDSETEIYFLLLQFQESDNKILKKCGKSTETKIILNLSDKPITCISGYKFNTIHGNTVSHLGKLMREDGTINGLKEIIHNIDDISYLPDELNVKAARWAYIHTKEKVDEELEEIIENIYSDDEYMSGLEKAIFRSHRNVYSIVVFDSKNGSIVYESTLISGDSDELFCKYLWIPVKETLDQELINKYQNENMAVKISV